jgi:hypothetical protein
VVPDRREDSQDSLEIVNIELSAFSAEVWFLIYTIKSPVDVPESWLELVHFARFTKGQRDVGLEIQYPENQPDDVPRKPLFAIENLSRNHRLLFEGLTTGIMDLVVPGSSAATWRRSGACVKGQALPYAVVFLDDVPEEQEENYAFWLRNFFRPEQVPVPTTAHLPGQDIGPYHEYFTRQWFTFSLDGAGFLACNAPQHDFYRGTLPNHLGHEYFFVYQIALFQRVALLRLSSQVARSWKSSTAPKVSAKTLQNMEDLRMTLYRFTARGHFGHVMQRQHHHDVYRKWWEFLQIQELFDEVSDEVEKISNYLDSKQYNQLEMGQRRLNSFLFLLGFPGLALGVLEVMQVDWPLYSVLLLLGGLCLVGFLVAWRLGRRH